LNKTFTASNKLKTMLKINNLQFERDDQTLFEPINLKVATGTCLQLCGPNGIGKTTLLKILAGLTKARRGKIQWQDQSVSSLATFAKYLGHELALQPQLSVLENLTYYACLMHAQATEITPAYTFFDLAEQSFQWIETLSAGQKHRCQLAKLLIGDATIWLLDEPFTALDQNHINQLIRLFKQFLDQAGIIIFTSHHPITTERFHIQPLLLDSPTAGYL
jgi:heme exporter protein A